MHSISGGSSMQPAVLAWLTSPADVPAALVILVLSSLIKVAWDCIVNVSTPTSTISSNALDVNVTVLPGLTPNDLSAGAASGNRLHVSIIAPTASTSPTGLRIVDPPLWRRPFPGEFCSCPEAYVTLHNKAICQALVMGRQLNLGKGPPASRSSIPAYILSIWRGLAAATSRISCGSRRCSNSCGSAFWLSPMYAQRRSRA